MPAAQPFDGEQFRLILDNVADLIAVLDTHGTRLYNSPSYEKVLADPSALLGTDSFMEIHPDDRQRLKQIFTDTVQSGVGRRTEYRFVRQDGGVRYIESQSDVVRDAAGKPVRVVVVSRDITERKRAEEEIRTAYRDLKALQSQLIQSEKLASIGQFAAGIVHDLKNPLGVVTLAVEVLQKHGDLDEAERAETIEAIREAGARAHRMVRELLSFSRRDELELATEPITPVVERSVALVKKERPPEHVTIETGLMPDAPAVPLDQGKIQQVLINLISNAIQAMPKEGGRVRVTTSTARAAEGSPRVGERASDFFKPGAETLVVEIADTGTGIPEDRLQKIWEPFFTTKPKDQGTGLGLAIVRSIVEAHHGVIEVTSQVGKGTTFRITLPVAGER